MSGGMYGGSSFLARWWRRLTGRREFDRASFDRLHLLAMVLYLASFTVFWLKVWYPPRPLSGWGLLAVGMPFVAILGGYDLLAWLLVRWRWGRPWRQVYAGNFFAEVASLVLVFPLVLGGLMIWFYDGYALRLNYPDDWARLSRTELRQTPFAGQEVACSGSSKTQSLQGYLATGGGPCKFIVTAVDGASVDAVGSPLDATVKPQSKEWGDKISGKAVMMVRNGWIDAVVRIPAVDLPGLCRIRGYLTKVRAYFPQGNDRGVFSDVSAAIDTDEIEIRVLPERLRGQVEAAQQRFASRWWLAASLVLGAMHVFWWFSRR